MSSSVTEASSNELTNREILSSHSISAIKVPNESCGIAEDNMSTSTGNGSCSLEPVTPDSNPESGDQFHRFASPLTIHSSSPNFPCFSPYQNNHPNFPNEDSPRTPKENVFDPFAPSPDKLLYANHEVNKDTILDEEKLFESLYGALLEAIISEQTVELVAKALTQFSESGVFRTPTSAPRLSGVADTYPGAPLKSSSKFRVIYKELCRKLEF
ncbi:Uncharacterized protein Adt_26172 [Abeliophyllum distichum]|uniref:Uncharacterized protein n=1 Tax=Abeliophyllum distichum TaxID=126358 RepID=A0ABD1RR80_9LAMI